MTGPAAVVATAVSAVHTVEHQALSWENPLEPHVELLAPVRVALGIAGEHYGDGCDRCLQAGNRWIRDHGTAPEWTRRTVPVGGLS